MKDDDSSITFWEEFEVSYLHFFIFLNSLYRTAADVAVKQECVWLNKKNE